MSGRAALPSALALVLVAACGRVVPHGGESPPAPAPAAATPLPRTFAPAELIPSDLDLVVRVDLAKVRSSLGGELPAEGELPLLDAAGLDAVARQALVHADVVWLASRVADLDEGDRVLAIEGLRGAPDPDALTRWALHATGVDGLRG